MIDIDNFFAISRRLEKYHPVFYKLWEMGIPVFDEKVKTAQVEFGKEGELLRFAFNPKFYNKLSDNELDFVLIHECLHVILNHGIRIKDSFLPDITNCALDIVVNHLIVNNFGIKRESINIADKLYWVDKVFCGLGLLTKRNETKLVNINTPNAIPVPTGKNFEFYYNLIVEELNKNANLKDLINCLQCTDGHDGLTAPNKDIIEQLDKMLSQQEKDSIKEIIEKNYQENKKDGLRAGTGTGNWTFINVGHVAKKRKWETVIKQWSRKYWKPHFKEMEQWARINRRFSMISEDLMIPSEMEMDCTEKEDGKIDVWFFQDTSGSCYHLKERFFKAASSLPTEKFNVRLFCFDTNVHETTLESKKIYGGGGTSFSIIESHIQNTILKESKKYPEAVFVITDGYGNRVNPQFPKVWYFFLSGSNRNYIPQDSNVFLLKNYE